MDIELSLETKALVTILRHITIVQKRLQLFIAELEHRATIHDVSKLSFDEFAGFVEINKIAREHPYGSKEYKDSLKGNETIKLHFSRNTHHPEYWGKGVEDMGIFDLIEMTIDWMAAAETYGQTTFEESLDIQQKRFNLSDKHMWLIKLIAKELQ
jgi:hypothetical protein